MIPRDQVHDLTVRIMNRLQRMDLKPVTRTTIELNVRAAIEGYCRDRGGDPFAVKIDALDLVLNTLREHEKELDKAIKDLSILTSENGDVTTALRRFGKYKLGYPHERIVRSQGRITVGECFDVGTRLTATTLWKDKPYEGRVEGLVLMRRRY